MRLHPTPVPTPALLVAFAGALGALAGGYWDDAWHTERGRDDFFIAPHLAIYGGVAVVGAALTAWGWLAIRAQGARGAGRDRGLVLAIASVGVTLASGPIDNAWHVAFGRDAVLWSPPHMLGIAGTFALGAALLVGLRARADRWASAARLLAGALVVAAAAFATAEFDTDVPQFDELFYLPALGLAAAIALVVVRSTSTARWAATAAAVLHLAFIALVGGFLWLLDFPPPALPLLVAPALVVDFAARRQWGVTRTAAGFTVALHLAYAPARNWLGDGVRFSGEDLLVGGALTFVAAAVAFAASRWLAGGSTRGALGPIAVAAVVGLALLALAPAALAHDPGQGDDAGTLGLRVAASERRISAFASLPPRLCQATREGAVVARRAGATVRAPLEIADCRASGSVEVSGRGRWFVYAELDTRRGTVESWLPVVVGDGRSVTADAERYAYVPPVADPGVWKTVAGVALYALVLGLVALVLRLSAAAPSGTRAS